MDYTSSYTAAYRVMRVDKKSWLDSEEIGKIIDCSITKDITDREDGYSLVDSADLTLVLPNAEEGYVRIYADTIQRGVYSSEPLGTFLLESSKEEIGYFETFSDSAELWSVLRPAKDRTLNTGYTIPRGINTAMKSAELLRECIDAPVHVAPNGELLADTYVVGENYSYLRIAWDILPDNWIISVDGNGEVWIRNGTPTSDNAHAVTDAMIIGDTVKLKWDLADIPNQVKVTNSGGEVFVASNNQGNSPTSIPSRGRIIEGDPSDYQRKSDESYTGFARRVLEDMSNMKYTISYKREYDPDISIGSTVSNPAYDGLFMVVSQSITCENGVVVDETAERKVSTWPIR